ncbi:hypothetical protein C8R43DRAFT_953754 [Mycena crocata]|nr:hypothetical protein C8R43DRAFT_953754 [Mycena crocata]
MVETRQTCELACIGLSIGHIKPSYPVFHTGAPAEKTETRGKIEHRASFTESSNRGWPPGIGRQVGQQNLSHNSQALQKWDRGAWGILLSVIALKPKECMGGMDKDSLDRETGLVSEEIATKGVRTFSITTLQYNNQINHIHKQFVQKTQRMKPYGSYT